MAERGFFTIPVKGLGDLIRNGIRAWPAILYETSGPEGIGEVNQKLREYEIRPEELDVEYLEPYAFVLENPKKSGQFHCIHDAEAPPQMRPAGIHFTTGDAL